MRTIKFLCFMLKCTQHAALLRLVIFLGKKVLQLHRSFFTQQNLCSTILHWYFKIFTAVWFKTTLQANRFPVTGLYPVSEPALDITMHLHVNLLAAVPSGFNCEIWNCAVTPIRTVTLPIMHFSFVRHIKLYLPQGLTACEHPRGWVQVIE